MLRRFSRFHLHQHKGGVSAVASTSGFQLQNMFSRSTSRAEGTLDTLVFHKCSTVRMVEFRFFHMGNT